MDRLPHIDIVMTRPPHADGEFVETEDHRGRGIGPDRGLEWVRPTPGDTLWRLRIPASAFGPPEHSAPVTWPGFAALLVLCVTVVVTVWLLTR